MIGDEVVRVGLGLRAGRQRLTGVLQQVLAHHRLDLRADLGMGKCRRGRECDLLLLKLIVDV